MNEISDVCLYGLIPFFIALFVYAIDIVREIRS